MYVKLSLWQYKRASLMFLTLFWVVTRIQIYLSFFLFENSLLQSCIGQKKHEIRNKQDLSEITIIFLLLSSVKHHRAPPITAFFIFLFFLVVAFFIRNRSVLRNITTTTETIAILQPTRNPSLNRTINFLGEGKQGSNGAPQSPGLFA